MTKFALKRPVTILMATLALCLLGAISWGKLSVQLLPEIIFPEVYVGAGLPGGSPLQVEREIIMPIEAEISQLDDVYDIESTARPNMGVVKISFNYGTNMKFALLKLQQRMNAVQNLLPDGAQVEIDRFDTSEFSTFLMQLSIRGEGSLEALREMAERKIRPRFEQIDGIVNVRVGGGQRRNISVAIDEEKCEALGIPIPLIHQRINAFHRPLQQVGRIEENNKIWDVVLNARARDLYDLREIILRPEGPVFLKDVAIVDYAQADQNSIYRVNGKSSVGIFLQKDNTSNMLAVAKEALAEIDRLNDQLRDQGYELDIGFNQAEMIQEAIDRVKSLALTGALLALIVLFLFLRNLRFVLILMVAIPISLFVTFNLMYAGDLTINVLSLCGLALAIGMLVDNGIVVMENIFSHYQRTGNARESAMRGTREMTRSIFAATATTILVFLPVVFVESDAQIIIKELALSIIFPLAVSLCVALTVIPLLSLFSLKTAPQFQSAKGQAISFYRLLLKSALRHRARMVSIVVVLLLMCIFIGTVFILSEGPPPPPDRLEVYLTHHEGMTLEYADNMLRGFEETISTFADVDEYRVNINEPNSSVFIQFLPREERKEKLNLSKLKERIRNTEARYRGVDLQFEQERQGGGGGFSGGDLFGAPEKALVLRGYDLQKLGYLSDQIERTLQEIDDINDRSVRSSWRSGAPELQIRGDRLQLALWQLSMRDIMQAIWLTRRDGSNTNTPMQSNQGEVDINLGLIDAEERTLQDLRRMKVTNRVGEPVPLHEVATLQLDEGESHISRRNQEREVRFTYSFRDIAQQSKTRLEQAENNVEQVVRQLVLPKGFTLTQEEEENENAPYYWMLGIGALLIFMFLAAQFESFFGPLVILGTIPTAIIGALLALALSGTPLAMNSGAPMAMLGLIVLLGIVVNNGIILLDRIAVLRTQHNYRWQRAIIIAGQSRVRPIIMTSMTTMLGVFPLALKQGTALEMWPPFAITVIGGLMVSSFSTLIFIPVLYVGLEQIREWLKKIGPTLVIITTAVAAGALYSFYLRYETALWTSILLLPLWFGLLGLTWFFKSMYVVHKEQQKFSHAELNIEISNLTKIYGAPGRFLREWRRLQNPEPESDQKSTDGKWPASFINRSIWLVAAAVFLGYLHNFISSPFWLTVLSLITVIYFFTLRGHFRSWRILKAKSVDKSGLMYRFSGYLIFILFLIYFYLRIGNAAFNVIITLLTLILWQFYRISKKIEVGKINPELPAGRLRRSKRFIYTMVQHTPIIKPPKPTVQALHGVDLRIGKGMFGLLGPNGAGKTTLMRILVGVLEQDRGSIKINNLNLDEHRDTFHGSIGYLPQDFGLYENMTPLEYLHHHALMNGIYEKSDRDSRISKILNSVGLWERRNDKVKTFSGGMRQRVGIAQTLLHLPQIIVVDEPTAGLDPRERIRFRNLLSELAKERIVLFSTHVVEDISSTCRDLAVLKNGEVIFRGSPEALQQKAAGLIYEATVTSDEFDRMQERYQIAQHSKSDRGIRVRFISETEPEVSSFTASEPNLEDAYLYLLNKANNVSFTSE